MKAMWGAALAALAISTAAVAQGGPGPGPGAGRGPGPATRKYDPATVTTVSGEVTAVQKVQGKRDQGVHVALKAADATYQVLLGPASFLASRSFEAKQGDRLEVTGSRVEYQGQPAIIAKSVKKGDTTVTLRDAQGVPAWAGGPKKP